MPDRTIPEMAPVEQSASNVAEQRAARRLEVSDVVVAIVSHHLWGRSLTDERDARFAAAEADATPNRGKALRGWITRELMAELEPAIRNATEGD